MPTTVSAPETLSETRTQTRELLLQTALSMLEQGWFPSITELANASGVSRATAYRYFPSQAALVSTVVDESLGPVLQWQPTSTSVEARVNELLDFAYPRMEQHEGALRAALQVALHQWANERARRAQDEPKYRRGNRRRLLTLAVEPMVRAGVDPAVAERLAQALSLLYGTEAMVVLKDIWGLDFRQFMNVIKWMSSALVRATLAQAGGAAGAGGGAEAGAGGAAAFYVLRAEVEQMSDSALQETAQRLLPLAVMDIVGRDSDGDDGDGGGGRIAAVRPHDELLTYIVRDETGKLLLRSHDANARLFPKNLKAGFARTATHRVYAETVLQGTVTLLIAEPLATRRRAEVQAAFAVVRPLALFLPVGLLGIWLIVRSGLTPIRRFCGAIAARGRNDLTPLDKGGLPAEIAPVADAVTELMARLDRALAAERSFTANSAHELRTPIAAALAQTQRLIAEAPAEPLRERARRVEGALHTLSRVSEQLMQLAKAEDGRVLADTPQDLRPVLALVVDDFRRGARDRAIALELPDTAVTSRIDPDAFAIVVRNLVENALKHGAAAEPVRVALSAAGALSVTNRGPVLAAAELERLTKPFERGATAAKGSGLGLAIVDAIAKGAGASFTLRSPAPGVTDGVQARVDGLACGGGPAAKG
ncbi:sensor histidine kinase [Burkholderia pseudomallei]|nr:sensor histidine kinase [Burkholderia pseudomallei]